MGFRPFEALGPILGLKVFWLGLEWLFGPWWGRPNEARIKKPFSFKVKI